MKGYVVIVMFDIVSEYFKDFLGLIVSNAEESIREDGCMQFDVAISDNKIFLYEVYKSKKAFEIHLDTEHYKNFQKKTGKYIIDKCVETYSLYYMST